MNVFVYAMCTCKRRRKRTHFACQFLWETGKRQQQQHLQEKRSRQRREEGKRVRIHIVVMWKRSNRIQHLPLMMTLYCYVLLSTGVFVFVCVCVCAMYVIKYVCKMNQYRVYNLHTLRLCVGLFHVVFFMLFSYVFLLFALLCTATLLLVLSIVREHIYLVRFGSLFIYKSTELYL